jgi:hypothetical protein
VSGIERFQRLIDDRGGDPAGGRGVTGPHRAGRVRMAREARRAPALSVH